MEEPQSLFDLNLSLSLIDLAPCSLRPVHNELDFCWSNMMDILGELLNVQTGEYLF